MCRGKNRRKPSSDMSSWTSEMDSQPSGSAADAGDPNNESRSGKVGETESEGAGISLQDRLKWAEPNVVRKVASFALFLEYLPNYYNMLFSNAYPLMS